MGFLMRANSPMTCRITPSRACPFRKFHPASIRIVANHRILISDVCESARARRVSSPTYSNRGAGLRLKLLLRHQLTIALRASPRLRLLGSDRALLLWMTRLWPSLLDAVRVVQPETVLRWHRAGFKMLWRWKSCHKAGRPKIDHGLRTLIRRMSRENPLWGASRIHGELLMLGFEVAQSTVSKYMVRSGMPPSQNWKTFLRNHAQAIAAIDLCVVPTLSL